MRYLLIPILLSIVLNGFAQSTRTSSNFARVQLPEGVSLEVPKSWTVLSGASKALLDTWLEAKKWSKVDSKAGFGAEAYDDNNRRLSALHVRYFPEQLATQEVVRKSSRADLIRLDEEMRREIERIYSTTGIQLLSWEGSTIEKVNGLVAVIYGLRRSSLTGSEEGVFRVRVVRILAGARSFSVTISYREQAAPLLEPVTDYIIRSIRQD